MGKFLTLVFENESDCKAKVLEFLQANRSRKEISVRVGKPEQLIEQWAAEFRSNGSLRTSKRAGMDRIHEARLASNGYYKSIRKRYASMIWTDKVNGRLFGFKSSLESIPYYLDPAGNPRTCAYCGKLPPTGKVWGLDRVDSKIGHVPGNLVPCCSSNPESHVLSCQASKSKFSLRGWLEASMSRTFGRSATIDEINIRVNQILELSKSLATIRN